MKLLVPLASLGLFLSSWGVAQHPLQEPGEVQVDPAFGPLCLMEAYPELLCQFRDNKIIWCDGTEMVYDDGLEKSYDERVSNPDLEDQVWQRYPRSISNQPPSKNIDPGRIRYAPFFEKMYGAESKEVRRRLGDVKWLPSTVNRTVRITTVNRIHEQLQKVSDELDLLPAAVKKVIKKSPGTFAWRTIQGTQRRSPHAYGIALDIGVSQADYWQWARRRKDGSIPFRNRIPMEIVEIFERHGFIWGGKWYHFDTMHFEYRPELLDPNCMN